MTSVNPLLHRCSVTWLGLALACATLVLAPTPSRSGPLSLRAQPYGPTTPGGYAVRVSSRADSMPHSQRRAIDVYVETPDGEPADGVAVRFRPSEGVVEPDHPETRSGRATGLFAAPPGSDQPRTATVVVSVENLDITVFIDIVPAVFGR